MPETATKRRRVTKACVSRSSLYPFSRRTPSLTPRVPSRTNVPRGGGSVRGGSQVGAFRSRVADLIGFHSNCSLCWVCRNWQAGGEQRKAIANLPRDVRSSSSMLPTLSRDVLTRSQQKDEDLRRGTLQSRARRLSACVCSRSYLVSLGSPSQCRLAHRITCLKVTLSSSHLKSQISSTTPSSGGRPARSSLVPCRRDPKQRDKRPGRPVGAATGLRRGWPSLVIRSR